MIIYFLRHASAGTHKADAKKDEKRALDKEGIEKCGMIGRALAARIDRLLLVEIGGALDQLAALARL